MICIICNTASRNTGLPSSAKPFGVPNMFIVMNLIADDGTVNKILSTDTLDPAYLLARLNDPDPSKRWYIISGVEQWDGAPRADTPFEEFFSGNKSKLSAGVKSATCKIPQTVSGYFGQLKKLGECDKIGMFHVDSCENLRGNGRITSELLPMRIAKNTWDAILEWAVDASNAQNTMLNFDFDKLERDEDLAHIPKESITADLTTAEGLRDVAFIDNVLTASDDTLIVRMKEIYGNPFDNSGVKGIALVDLSMTVNLLAAVIFSVTEDADEPGLYSIVLTTDVLVTQAYTLDGSKNGLEFTLINGVAAA